MPKTIFLSAGHSGADCGALSLDKQHKEADLALTLRDKTAALLRLAGVTVEEDGRDGENKPLRDALVLARAYPGRSVEIHFNAAANPAAKGVEALCHPAHKKLAQELCKAVASATGSPLRGEYGWKSANSGQHHRLGFCDAGGVILEIEFISNPSALQSYLANADLVSVRLAAVLEQFSKA